MSSLFSSNGASIIFFKKKDSESTSNGCFVIAVNFFQCRPFIALFAISSSSGQLSLKSSIFFFKSLNACQFFNAFGSLRHLDIIKNIERKLRKISVIQLHGGERCKTLSTPFILSIYKDRVLSTN